MVFAPICGISLWMWLAYYRHNREREAAREKAETANRAKSAFLATMSHELRTPLNAIIGFSDMMLSEAPAAISNMRHRGYIADIHASGSHLLEIINDVLDLSKAEAGKLILDEDIFDVGEIIRSVSQLTRVRVHEHGLTETTALPPDLPLSLSPGYEPQAKRVGRGQNRLPPAPWPGSSLSRPHTVPAP